MAQQSSNHPTLYPHLESTVAPLDESAKYLEIIEIEKELVSCLRDVITYGDLLQDVTDTSILPSELLENSKKIPKPKIDPLKRLKELPSEEAEDEEETEDEEEEDEELAVEDEEDDAGGDYVVSHFDNGEGYEDNDDEGDEMNSSVI